MPPGDSQLVPDPPPPRPVARDEAIAAAMRRFDGVEDNPPVRAERPRSTGGWIRKPQFATAMSLGLIAIIGGPLTWMAVRNGALNPPSEPAAPPTASSPAVAPSVASEAVPSAQAIPSRGAPASDAAAPPPPEAKKDVAPVVAAPVEQRLSDPAQELAVAPPAPPPPPPPAPPPAPMAEKSAEGTVANDIAVTGSRIRRPNLTTASPVTVPNRSAERDEAEVVNSLPKAQAPAAPGWVTKDRAYATFLSQLQGAVRTGNRDGVIRLIRFPLRVNANGKSRVYRNAASVRANYDQVFTPQVRQAILNQKFDRLFGRDQGLMIGDGQVWFDHTCPNAQCSPPGPVRITAINP